MRMGVKSDSSEYLCRYGEGGESFSSAMSCLSEQVEFVTAFVRRLSEYVCTLCFAFVRIDNYAYGIAARFQFVAHVCERK